MISIQRNGTFRSWREPGGADILFERHEDRGGAIPAVPMVGRTPETAWSGADRMPVHGCLWQVEPDSKDISQTGAVEGAGGFAQEFDIVMRPRLGVFPWYYHVRLRYIVIEDHQLTYQILVTRDQSCPNENDMPLSCGFLPFFATRGQDFCVRENCLGIANQQNDLAPGRLSKEDLTAESVITLETDRGTLTFDCLSGFDRIYLQHDWREGYICVAPVLSKLADLHLARGMSHCATARLTFKANR